MLASTSSFVDGLENWLRAVRSDDFATAKDQVEQLAMAGDLLVIHPDFIQCFRKHCNGLDPKEALVQLCQFLRCATNGRSRALKRRQQDGRAATLGAGEDESS